MNNYGKFHGTLSSDVNRFNTRVEKPAWSFRIAVEIPGADRPMTVHCLDYSGIYAACIKGDTITIDGAVTIKKREVDGKIYHNLCLMHR